ncbi:MAG: lipase family protein [Gemmataceae bacterium]|nr:lipase family protein [Gemmataceae bacterium]
MADLSLPANDQKVLQNAFYLAHLAKAVYEDAPEDYPRYEEFGIDTLLYFASPDGSVRGFTAKTDACVLLVFRGSDDVLDWVRNLDFAQVDAHGGRVHRGFYFTMDTIWSEMNQRLNQLLPSPLRGEGSGVRGNLPLWITGHSLGGALATLAARRLADTFPIAGVYTFGQPRVGDPDFVDAFPEEPPHYRFVNNQDVVTQVPMRWFFNSYKHHGQLYYFDKKGKLSHSDSRWNKMALAFVQFLANRDSTEAQELMEEILLDHDMDRYIERIEGNL